MMRGDSSTSRGDALTTQPFSGGGPPRLRSGKGRAPHWSRAQPGPAAFYRVAASLAEAAASLAEVAALLAAPAALAAAPDAAAAAP